MDAATIIADWQPFFAAQLGAAAALAGLVFVGLSINLQKILAEPALPNRALLALAVLLGAVMVSSYVLIPLQDVNSIGAEILATGGAFAIFGAAVEVHTLRTTPIRSRRMFLLNMVFLGFALLPYVIGGALLIGGSVDGLYWVAAAVIISFVKAISDAWVLLVEINR